MRKTALAVRVAAGSVLLGLASASPALAARGKPPSGGSGTDTQLCSLSANGGTLVGGVCVLPAMTQGQPAEDVLANSGGGVDRWTIVSGSLPPGTQMPAEYGAGNTIIGGTPTQPGTFTFTVDNVPFTDQDATPSQGTYSITVGPAPALAVVLPASGSTLTPGTVGVAYAQDFFVSGGIAPYSWSVASGQLPPGLALTGNQLAGTPSTAGTFTFTMKVTDSSGEQATQQFTLTIQP